MIEVQKIIDFEEGTLSHIDTLKLFSVLIKTGQCWSLQGFYGRYAKNLIDNGIIDFNGNILIEMPIE